jgi:hypothetical protein
LGSFTGPGEDVNEAAGFVELSPASIGASLLLSGDSGSRGPGSCVHESPRRFFMLRVPAARPGGILGDTGVKPAQAEGEGCIRDRVSRDQGALYPPQMPPSLHPRRHAKTNLHETSKWGVVGMGVQGQGVGRRYVDTCTRPTDRAPCLSRNPSPRSAPRPTCASSRQTRLATA